MRWFRMLWGNWHWTLCFHFSKWRDPATVQSFFPACWIFLMLKKNYKTKINQSETVNETYSFAFSFLEEKVQKLIKTGGREGGGNIQKNQIAKRWFFCCCWFKKKKTNDSHFHKSCQQQLVRVVRQLSADSPLRKTLKQDLKQLANVFV